MRIGIIGCGLIGAKRAKALYNHQNHSLIACCDINRQRAENLASKYSHGSCIIAHDFRELTSHPDIDLLIVATTHNLLCPITKAALIHNKHVLVEKPAALRSEDLKILFNPTFGIPKVHVGFNHRFHRAFIHAKRLINDNSIGDLLYIRARYGHGGRLGYESEWRANPALSGGGELIDQGIHLIDLARWFLGDFSDIEGFAHTYFWKMPVEDNGFILLKTRHKQAAFLHVSCTEWKNTFSFEIYGRRGKIEICGLGGTYGVETLKLYQMLPEMGPPMTQIWEYPMEDNSFEAELSDFIENITKNKPPSCSIEDAYESLKIIEQIYRMSGYDYHAQPA